MAKVVLITGCSSGLGRALALRLHAERLPPAGGSSGGGHGTTGTNVEEEAPRAYSVWASARNVAALRDLEEQGIKTVQLDVTSQKSVDAAVRRVVQEDGRIDVLVNNAGLSRVGPVVEQPMDEVEEVMAANYFGVLRTTQAVAPHMMRQRSGLVVMIGSVVSMLATPYGGAYSASKAALLALTDSMRLELRPFGVHVSYVVAGAITSSFSNNILSGTNVSRYEKPSSLYAPLAGMIRARAEMSQDPKTSVPASAAAGEIAAVISASMLPPPPTLAASILSALAGWVGSALPGRAQSGYAPAAADGGSGASGSGTGGGDRSVWRPLAPPNWFLAGGNARQFWLVGVAQKLLPQGWPTNAMLAKKFRLDQPI